LSRPGTSSAWWGHRRLQTDQKRRSVRRRCLPLVGGRSLTTAARLQTIIGRLSTKGPLCRPARLL